MIFSNVSVDPVEDIEYSINAQSYHIICCNIFNFSDFGEHMELREDGNSFKPDGERPDIISNSPASVNKKSKNKSARNQVSPVLEVITKSIITDTVWFFEFHKIDDISSGGNEKSFHENQVEVLMRETVEKIQISTAKYQ